MINTIDLRIGNLLKYGSDVSEVSTLHSDNTLRFWAADKSTTIGCFHIGAPSIKPIPLTQEWHTKTGEIKLFREGSFEFRHNFDNTGSIYAWQSGQCVFIRHVKFVHEWQNAYWTLTSGNELKITL